MIDCPKTQRERGLPVRRPPWLDEPGGQDARAPSVTRTFSEFWDSLAGVTNRLVFLVRDRSFGRAVRGSSCGGEGRQRGFKIFAQFIHIAISLAWIFFQSFQNDLLYVFGNLGIDRTRRWRRILQLL